MESIRSQNVYAIFCLGILNPSSLSLFPGNVSTVHEYAHRCFGPFANSSCECNLSVGSHLLPAIFLFSQVIIESHQ